MDESRRSARSAQASTNRHKTLMRKDREMVDGADPHHPAGPASSRPRAGDGADGLGCVCTCGGSRDHGNDC